MNQIISRFQANKLIIYSAVLAFFGFIDSLYLTISHYKNITPPCSIQGCDAVLTSAYAAIGPIPVALLGVIFYVAVVIICLMIIIEGKKALLKLFYFTVLIGFFFSVVFFLIQFSILKSFCQYCILSEVISLGLLALSLLKFREDKAK